MPEPKFDFGPVGDGSGLEAGPRVYPEELALAFRNRAMPLEALRYDVTPVGLHYVLVHYDIPLAEAAGWTVSIDGAVARPREVTLEELQRREQVTLRVTLECAGDGRALLEPRPISQPWQHGAVGTAEWTGVRLRALLEETGLGDDAIDLVFTGADRGVEAGFEQDYQRSLPRADALRDDALLAWGMNGRPLEPQHGFPLRLVIPGWFGMAHVKWLRRITALAEPYDGYQNTTAYRYSQSREEAGEPVDLMLVRSLIEPPGIPEFMTRTRVVRRGRVELRGRAWSGRQPITRVEVSTDGGGTWGEAAVDAPSDGGRTWQAWRFSWEARAAGTYDLLCRATDATGAVQPVDQAWTARGMGNNMAHRVRVQVL